MQATGSWKGEAESGTYGAIVVEQRGTLDVLAAGVRVFAFARIEVEEEEALEIPAARIHGVALHFAEPLVLVLDPTSHLGSAPTP